MKYLVKKKYGIKVRRGNLQQNFVFAPGAQNKGNTLELWIEVGVEDLSTTYHNQQKLGALLLFLCLADGKTTWG